MADDLDAKTKLELYRLVINRYRDMINDKESLSISEIRQKVSPYNDFIRKMREGFLKDMVPYDHKRHFFPAAEKAVSYVRGINTCEFAFNFWMDFGEMDKLKIATSMDKAILLAALLRSFESEDVRVLVTKKGKAFVRFLSEGKAHLFVPESGSLLMGEDSLKVFEGDPIAYSFNDLVYENFEEA